MVACGSCVYLNRCHNRISFNQIAHDYHTYTTCVCTGGFHFFCFVNFEWWIGKKKCINLFSFIEVQCILLATIKPQFILKCSTHQNIAYINEYWMCWDRMVLACVPYVIKSILVWNDNAHACLRSKDKNHIMYLLTKLEYKIPKLLRNTNVRH